MSDLNELFGADDLINVTIFYTVQKNKSNVNQIVILSEERAKKMLEDPKDKLSVKSITTKWRPQTWKQSNDMLKSATYYNHTTQSMDIDWTAYRDLRLKTGLVEWDAVDSKGNLIEVTPDNINKLHSSVAIAMLDAFDKSTAQDNETITKN